MTSATIDRSDVPLLRVDDIHAAYVKKKILHGVSLTVNQGEIVAILGGNGSGKSTLLKTIAGLLRPVRGRIAFRGRDITGASVHARQKDGIGYLLQGGRVFPNLSVQENFDIAIKHRRNGCQMNVTRVGSIFPPLAGRVADRAGLLSGGQRQMLAIEMVLAQEPEVVLLDEPTGALSHDLALGILHALRDHVLKTGCCVLLVEQNQVEARSVSSRCLQLVEGTTRELVE